jgi:hypothetical protein
VYVILSVFSPVGIPAEGNVNVMLLSVAPADNEGRNSGMADDVGVFFNLAAVMARLVAVADPVLASLIVAVKVPAVAVNLVAGAVTTTAGLATVNGSELDDPPPGAGFTTLIWYTPGVAMATSGTVRVIFVAETLTGEYANVEEPFVTLTLQFPTNPDPTSVRFTDAFGLVESGDTEVRVGVT